MYTREVFELIDLILFWYLLNENSWYMGIYFTVMLNICDSAYLADCLFSLKIMYLELHCSFSPA